MPAKVKLLLLFAPTLIVTPPTKLTFNMPLLTVSRVVVRLPFTSLTEIVLMPAKASVTSSFTVCALGTVLTGAALLTAT